MFYSEHASLARITPPKEVPEDAADALPREKPSKRMLRTWMRKVETKRAQTFPVYTNGGWTLQVFRGKKRALSLKIGRTL